MSGKNQNLDQRKKAQYSLRINEASAVRESGHKTRNSYRTEFMRDRDRVLYSKAFRRLAGKAQVYIAGVDDHKRTRLTHTLEVSQIARAVAEPLKLDVNLVEAIALGHDLGHTPFGHAGERILHEIMTYHEKDHPLGLACPLDHANFQPGFAQFQGFKHNLQSLVVAMNLEKNHEAYGLDLTNYTLYGIQAHSKSVYKPGRMKNHDKLSYYTPYLNRGCRVSENQWAWSLEALLVAEADEIAQHHHDLEDALFGGLISPEEVVNIITNYFEEEELIKHLPKEDKQMWKNPKNCDLGKFNALISRVLVNLLVTRLTAAAAFQINRLGKEKKVTYNTFPKYREKHAPTDEEIMRIFKYSNAATLEEAKKGFCQKIDDFSREISNRVLSSHDIQKADAKGQYIIKKIFQAYYSTPQQLPNHCVYEFLSEYHRLSQDTALQPLFRSRVEVDSETKLREKAGKEGVGSVRSIFGGLFMDRSQVNVMEELILMRTICNHIACMTDAYAKKIYQELYG